MRSTLFAVLSTLAFASAAARAQGDTLKIFLLFGQSNMEGQAYTYDNANTDGWNIPTMEFLLGGSPEATNYLANLPFGFKGSLDASWLDPRADVWCVHYNSQNGNLKEVRPTEDTADNFTGVGPLSPGFGVGTGNGSMFGAELAMGIRLGDVEDDPILLFKSDKGGTTLGNDWRPPLAVAKRGGVVGTQYANSIASLVEFLDDLDADLLDNGTLDAYAGATGYEVCGVFWLQGWNEKFDDQPYTAAQLQAEYADNLCDLIYSIRAADPRIPDNLGLIVGESSDQDPNINAGRLAAVAALNGEIADSAAYFDTAGTKGGNYGNNLLGAPFSQNWGFHFHARAENFLEIGWKAAGSAMDTGMLDGGAEFYLGGGEADAVTFNSATLDAFISADADVVKVVWDSVDRGADDVSDWPNSLDLSPWTGGADDIAAAVTGLAEDTAYVARFYASSAALGAESWTRDFTFTTLFENPPPLLGAPANTPPTTESTTVSCDLSRADATGVHLVWANEDQGESDVATWAGAAGGGSFSFGATPVDSLLSHEIGGLEDNTVYVARLVASNAFGIVWTEALPFRTARSADDYALTAYYDFEGEGDDRFDDPAGAFADNLAGQHNPAFAADSPGAFAGTQSAIFDGNSALFTDAYTTDLGPDPGAYTIMFWVKGRDIDQENNNTRLMTTRVAPDGSGTGVNSWQVEGFGNNGNNGDKMDLRMHGLGGTNNWFSNDAVNALARQDQGEAVVAWHHVAFVVSNNGHSVDGGVFGLTYVDGAKAGGEYGGPNPDWDGLNLGNQTGQLIIGGNAEGAGNRAFTGQLDDVALFAGIVPAAEIAAIAAGTKSPMDYLVEPTPFEITDVKLLPGDKVRLTWNSQPGETYTVFWSTDGESFDADAGDSFPSGGATTTVEVDSATAPIGTAPVLLFKVGVNADP